jgi:hypothetical protein
LPPTTRSLRVELSVQKYYISTSKRENQYPKDWDRPFNQMVGTSYK